MSKVYHLGPRDDAGRLTGGAVVPVGGELAHHLRDVVRLRVGAPLRVADADGRVFDATVDGLDPVTVAIVGEVAATAEPSCALAVWVPHLKGGRSDDLVRQLTELGASRVVIYESTRSVVRLPAAKVRDRVARWEAIAVAACQQSGRVRTPVVSWSAAPPEEGPGVFLWEGATTAARVTLEAAPELAERILVGPEGGLSASEAEALVSRGWQPVMLGVRILRAETAVVAAATLALHALGEAGF